MGYLARITKGILDRYSLCQSFDPSKLTLLCKLMSTQTEEYGTQPEKKEMLGRVLVKSLGNDATVGKNDLVAAGVKRIPLTA